MSTKTKTTPRKATNRISFRTPLFYFQDADKHFHKYCPALGILGVGYTEEEADTSFRTVLRIDIEFMKKKNTLRKVLQELNWKILKWTPAGKEVQPPDFSVLLKNDKLLKDIMLEYNFRKEEGTVTFVL